MHQDWQFGYDEVISIGDNNSKEDNNNSLMNSYFMNNEDID